MYEPLGAYSSVLDVVLSNSIRTTDMNPVDVRPYEDNEDNEEEEDVRGGGIYELVVGTYDIESCVRSMFPECFREGERVTKVLRIEDGYLVNATSRFCLNLGRNHSSNKVFFYVNRTGVIQKCFCHCSTTEGRKNGRCQDFSCKRGPLPPLFAKSRFGRPEVDFRRLLAGVSAELSSL